MNTSPSPWTPYVRSDVYAGACDEDGRNEHLSFYVICENERGRRYASRVHYTTEEFARHEAEARADAFCAKVATALAEGADPARSDKWVRIQGCYGSAEWSEVAELEDEARVLEVEAGVQEANRFRRAAGLAA